MADNEETPKDQENAETTEEQEAQKDAEPKPDGKKSILPLILMGLGVVALAGGAGVCAAMFQAGQHDPTAAAESEDDGPNGQADHLKEDFEYYELEPLIVNLNVKQQNRYLKVGVLLGIREADKDKVFTLIDKKKVILKDRLMGYLAGHTLEQVAGDKNPVRMKREIRNILNKLLWPGRKPKIDHVLFQEWAIQ